MSVVRVTLLLLSLVSLASFTGCVGPMGCAPNACGPVAFGGGGCGQCNDCSGCGELYVDPWINHPADVCDPCDCCGNFNGQSCGKCRPMFSGFRSLWGYRCDDGGAGGCDTGCDVGCGAGGCDVGCGAGGCDAGGCTTCGGATTGQHHGSINFSRGVPTLAEPTIVEVSPRITSTTVGEPERTRKIFRPRGAVANSGTPQPIR